MDERLLRPARSYPICQMGLAKWKGAPRLKGSPPPTGGLVGKVKVPGHSQPQWLTASLSLRFDLSLGSGRTRATRGGRGGTALSRVFPWSEMTDLGLTSLLTSPPPQKPLSWPFGLLPHPPHIPRTQVLSSRRNYSCDQPAHSSGVCFPAPRLCAFPYTATPPPPVIQPSVSVQAPLLPGVPDAHTDHSPAHCIVICYLLGCLPTSHWNSLSARIFNLELCLPPPAPMSSTGLEPT